MECGVRARRQAYGHPYRSAIIAPSIYHRAAATLVENHCPTAICQQRRDGASCKVPLPGGSDCLPAGWGCGSATANSADPVTHA